MSETLEQLRTSLAQVVGTFKSGTATGGTVATLIDTNALVHIEEPDALAGALLRIATTTDTLAPQGEARKIVGFDEMTKIITVEYDFSAVIGSGDTYEIFTVGLSLAQWDQAINNAIKLAWPEVYSRQISEEDATGADSYSLPADCEDLLDMFICQGVGLGSWPSQRVSRLDWQTEGDPGSLTAYLAITPPAGQTIRWIYKSQFDELAADDSATTLDEIYLLAAARAEYYDMLVGEDGLTSGKDTDIKLMAHWQSVAGERKARLADALERRASSGGKKS